MLDLKGINARIEPGAIIRDRVEIGDRAVIMMAPSSTSAPSLAKVHDRHGRCAGRPRHRGQELPHRAGTVLAGVVEPASATPVIIEDDCFIGSRASWSKGRISAANRCWAPA